MQTPAHACTPLQMLHGHQCVSLVPCRVCHLQAGHQQQCAEGKGEGEDAAKIAGPHGQHPHGQPTAKPNQSFLSTMYLAAQQTKGGSLIERMEHPCMRVSWATAGLSEDMVAGLVAAGCLVSVSREGPE